MAFRTDLSKLIELSEARAMLINGGDGPETPPRDEDGVCDASSVGNVKITENNEGTQGTVAMCTEKTKRNGDTKFKWKVIETSGF
jgi:hypothetical protein